MPFNSEEQLHRNRAIFKTLFLSFLPLPSALPLRGIVTRLTLFLRSLEGVPRRAILEWSEVPHDGGVAGVDLDILHFLFLSIMIIIEH